MAKAKQINALAGIKMNFSTLGIRTGLKDYELAYWLNVHYSLNLVCREKPIDTWEEKAVWEYNVFDGTDNNGEPLCMVMNISSGAQLDEEAGWSLFESTPEKHLLPSVKHWDYLIMTENSDFAFDLEHALKRNDKITTAQYFEAHTKLTTQETHLLYEIRNI